MSRKYMNDRWCVRCGRTAPTPYLKRNLKHLPKTGRVLDIGCGNGRNSKFMVAQGYTVDSIDMVGDFGKKCMLGEDPLPKRYKYDILLANYVLMFLDNRAYEKTIAEMLKVAKVRSWVMIEMYPAKDAYAYHMPHVIHPFEEEGFEAFRQSKDRCILRRT